MRGWFGGNAVTEEAKLAAEKAVIEAKLAAEKLVTEKAAIEAKLALEKLAVEKQKRFEAIKAKKLALNPWYRDFDEVFFPEVENKKAWASKTRAEVQKEVEAAKLNAAEEPISKRITPKTVAKSLDFSPDAQHQARKPKTAAEVK